MSIVDLVDAEHATVGGKASPLAELARAGFNVPTGFVVPATTYQAAATALGLAELSIDRAEEARSRILRSRLPDGVVDDVSRALKAVTEAASTDYVAVRSSSIAEDSAYASAAGQHDSVLAVRGTEQVCQAILQCWASLWTERAVAYKARQASQAAVGMAVIVQRFVDASVSGVMFTGATTVVEATWGIGERLVAGHITPDSWRITDSGIERRPGSKSERTDRHDGQLITRHTTSAEQTELCLTDHDILRLRALGEEVSTTLGGPRDVEWAIDDGTIWVLQARPVTALVPGSSAPGPTTAGSVTISGEPASPGVASGPVRLVRGPADFPKVKRGDVLVCRHTDPAWTPLFTIASAVVTETGGVLSHAAIVAREVGIPAVLAVPRATEVLTPPSVVTVNGNTGHICVKQSTRSLS
ncbi:PEP/pyruvate-binding domain-containing protein [Agromyces subbeticus]|uniref:PEP/pyruvate-binding domain-containing protein n=1 Tax=Agromyces subbeticus TaxID=293890 RepID=UPI00047C435A|nr:PEP/pyruvate-binding domain-containing protein [Agromyces subbeticus]